MTAPRKAGRQRALLLVLLLGGCGKPTVTGNVADPFGNPISDATVAVEGTSFLTTTDNDGQYDVEFVPGEFKVHIKKDGYTSSTASFNVVESTTVPAAAVILYPMPTAPGIYYVGKEKLEPLSTSRTRREQVRSQSMWLSSTTRFFLQNESPLVLPEGEARFIDTTPQTIELARATSRSGLILDTAHSDVAGFIETESERVGDEELTVRIVKLEPGVYGWVELSRTVLGGTLPGESYYGFQVGEAPWFTSLGTYTSTFTFDPEATQQEMAYSLELWRDPAAGIVGHLNYPVVEFDTPAGRLENVRHDTATGELSFRAKVRGQGGGSNEIHEFTGELGPESIDGIFKRHSEDGALLQTQSVSLKKQPGNSFSQQDTYDDLVAWQQHYSEPILRFRGPR